MSNAQYNVDFREVFENMRKAGGEESVGLLEAIWVAGNMADDYSKHINKINGFYMITFDRKSNMADMIEGLTLGIRYAKHIKHVAEISLSYKKIFLNGTKKNEFVSIEEKDKRKVNEVLDRALKQLAVM